MKFPEHLLKPSPRVLRQFAAGWILFFAGASAWQFFARGRAEFAVALASMALAGAMLWLWRPAFFRGVFVSSMVVSFPIGWIVSQVALSVMFFLVITPVALAFRLMRRDRLRRRAPERTATSLWSKRATEVDVRRYFRPY